MKKKKKKKKKRQAATKTTSVGFGLIENKIKHGESYDE